MHVAKAHLGELIKEHHHPQVNNDEVLEKGNRDMKRFRDMTFWGGSSKLGKRDEKVKQMRWRMIREALNGNEAEYESYVVQVPRQQASWVACMHMQVAQDILAGRRLHVADEKGKGKRLAAKKAKAEQRDIVKAESVTSVKRRCLSTPPPDVTPVGV